MTKLEEKLIELGYGRIDTKFHYKDYEKKFRIFIRLENINKITKSWIDIKFLEIIETQQDIDNLQQAYNILQKDLEVLKEYE